LEAVGRGSASLKLKLLRGEDTRLSESRKGRGDLRAARGIRDLEFEKLAWIGWIPNYKDTAKVRGRGLLTTSLLFGTE
jgi:hypothetical protein